MRHQSKFSKTRVNETIRSSQVRVVGASGEQIGIVSIQDALQRAEDNNLDLVEVAPEAKPPVCRIMDFSKYKYDQEKKEKELKKKQRQIQIKEIKLKPKIEEHDYRVKLGNLERFLKRGDRVKITMWFRGRENQYKEIGRKILDRIANDMAPYGQLEVEPKEEGRNIIMVAIPKT